MKTKILTVFFICFLTITFTAQKSHTDYKIGDTFVIQQTDNNNYKHINFPKANFIIKKGGIADFKQIVGKEVEISSTKNDKNGDLIATIKLVSGIRFFNSHKYLTVNIKEAIENDELKFK